MTNLSVLTICGTSCVSRQQRPRTGEAMGCGGPCKLCKTKSPELMDELIIGHLVPLLRASAMFMIAILQAKAIQPSAGYARRRHANNRAAPQRQHVRSL